MPHLISGFVKKMKAEKLRLKYADVFSMHDHENKRKGWAGGWNHP